MRGWYRGAEFVFSECYRSERVGAGQGRRPRTTSETPQGKQSYRGRLDGDGRRGGVRR